MKVLQIILYILVFLISLSLVVSLHELGHFVMAKIFHVYCYEFSVGFGHPLVHKKFRHKVKNPVYDATAKPLVRMEEKKEEQKALEGEKALLLSQLSVKEEKEEEPLDPSKKYIWKEGETYFSIRLLPLGGYVSMAGEEEEKGSGDDKDSPLIPENRTLGGLSPFKQIPIMLAGIAMNFLLAFLLFFCDFAFTKQTVSLTDSPAVTVLSDSETETYEANRIGLESGDTIVSLYQEYTGLVDSTTKKTADPLFFPENGFDTTLSSYASFEEGSSLQTFDTLKKTSIMYAIQDVFEHNAEYQEGGYGLTSPIAAFQNLSIASSSVRKVHILLLPQGAEDKKENRKELLATLHPATSDTVIGNNNNKYLLFEKLGITSTSKSISYSAKDAFVEAGNTFGYLFTALFKAIGGLFTPSGWSQMGGIISVYQLSTSGIQTGQVGQFLLIWGYISLDLGLFNLIPLPGLDGWQTLLALAEGISRKKIPSKFKQKANGIGLFLLLGLAVAMIIKDIIRFI